MENNKLVSCAIIVLIVLMTILSKANHVNAAELIKATPLHGLENIFTSLKQTSRQGASFLTDLIASIPFGKIALASGALLSLILIFFRLLVVLGPILILGAMTRESTDTTDLIRTMIEFYKQVIVALNEQIAQSDQSQPI